MSVLKGVKIFAEGVWNGAKYGTEHMQSMVKSFSELYKIHKVPLKFGHNPEQKITDGLPALGWVDRVYMSEDNKVLLADFTDVPDLVARAIKARRYRKLSIEMDMGVEHKGKKFMSVLSGVALLGADIPAINTLDDLEQYIPKEEFTSDSLAVFTIDEPNFEPKQEESYDMDDLKEMKDELAKFSAKLDDQSKENAELRDENKTLKANFSALEAEKKAKEDEAQAATVKAARESITAMFDTAVKAELITPAMRTAFFSVLRVDDDESVVKISADDVKALLPEGGKALFTADTGKEGGADERAPAEIVTEKAYAAQSTNGSLSFAAAVEQVLRSDHKLAVAYRDQNIH